MSERNYSLLESLQSEAERLQRVGFEALTSSIGGALGVINTLRSHGFRKGILILLALGMGISACGGGPGSTVEAPTTQPEQQALPSSTEPVISNEPAGFGLTPVAEVDPIPSPEFETISGEIFVKPTQADEKNYMREEAVPPESIRDEVALSKKNLEARFDEIARECGVEVSDLKASYKEGSVATDLGSEFRWTVVAETKDGSKTCWTINAQTGQLTQYPTNFNSDWSVKSVDEGYKWKIVDGSMDWFGTVPGLIRPGEYVVPEGMTGLQLSDRANWNNLEAGVPIETGIEIKSPFNEADTQRLSDAKYEWDSANGALVSMRNGQPILWFDGRSWVDEAGVESSIESLKIFNTNGVDYDGNDIHALLLREVEDRTEMYNFIIGEWQEPLDIPGSIEAVSKNNIPKNLENWQEPVKIEIEGVHKATWPDFTSGRLFLSDLLHLGPLPEDVNIQPLLISMQPLIQNHWTLSQFLAGKFDLYWGENNDMTLPPDKDRFVVVDNDAIRVVSAHIMISPLTGERLTVTGVRYQVNGRDLVLYLFTGGSTTTPVEEGGAYNLIEDAWSYPASRVLLPIVSVREGDHCNLGSSFAAQNVCDLVGYDGTPIPRELLPPDLQTMIAEWDSDKRLTSRSKEAYPVNAEWVFALQEAVLPANIVQHNGLYYNLEEDLDHLRP